MYFFHCLGEIFIITPYSPESIGLIILSFGYLVRESHLTNEGLYYIRLSSDCYLLQNPGVIYFMTY